jgi:hypothetical protein
VQDPLSLRCVTQVHGAALAALRTARDHVELELNSAADSPLVLTDAGEMLSTGNFHIPGFALAFETLGLALAHAALTCVQRCQKLFNPALSGLPLQLTTRGPEHSGFATVQKTLTALYNEIRHDASPATLDSLPVSETVEDHAPMAQYVVAKTAAIVAKLQYLAPSSSGGRASHRLRMPPALERDKELTRRTRAAPRSMRTALLDRHRNRRRVLAADGIATTDCCRDDVASQQLGSGLVALPARRFRPLRSASPSCCRCSSVSGQRATIRSFTGPLRSVGSCTPFRRWPFLRC